ncbi:MAG: SPOR domain-containing protein [Sphingorhabdus sp.]
MSDTTRESLDLDDEDRLPWLETAEDYDEDGEYSPVRVTLFVLAGVLLLGAIVGGIYWLQNRDGGGLDGNGELIAAQEGDYKVRPDDPQAKQFEGEGDASFAASEGEETPAQLGNPEQAEAPIRKSDAAPTADAAGSVLIQLGAFSSAGLADSSWSGYARRFESIGSLPKKILPGSVDGGTIYRLNAVAPSREAAQQICNNLKAAGESCLVVR